MYPYGGDELGYQRGSVCEGTHQYHCDYGCLQSTDQERIVWEIAKLDEVQVM